MHRVAIVLGAILIVVYGVEAFIAITQGVIVVGWNAWRQPLFAVMQLIVALVAGPALVWWAMNHWNDDGPPVDKDR